VAENGSEPGDEVLARRFREGDAQALCTLFKRHDVLLRARIERIVPPRVRRRVSPSDILQESQIVAFDRRRDFEARGPRAFRNWALGIVENKARREVQRHDGVAMRAAGREDTATHRAATEQFASAGPTPSQLAIAEELAGIARDALEALSEDHREVLRLVRDEHLSLREAGERMGRSHAAAKKLYGRALTEFGRAFRRLRGTSRG